MSEQAALVDRLRSAANGMHVVTSDGLNTDDVVVADWLLIKAADALSESVTSIYITVDALVERWSSNYGWDTSSRGAFVRAAEELDRALPLTDSTDAAAAPASDIFTMDRKTASYVLGELGEPVTEGLRDRVDHGCRRCVGDDCIGPGVFVCIRHRLMAWLAQSQPDGTPEAK